MIDLNKDKPTDVRTAYFIGIGGIGMSALARYFRRLGAEVFGYDKTETTLTKKLVDEGMKIHYSDEPDLITDNIDIIIYTPAIPADHKEANYLRDKGFDLYKRSEILGWISKSYLTIAVAGTHGKTTTSTLLAYLLKEGGVDCTAFLGGISKDFEGNYAHGNADWVVVEADEYDRSFLRLFPQLSIVLSMDADHLDIYGKEDTIRATFSEFAQQTARDGKIFFRHGLPLNVGGIENESFGIGKGAYSANNVRVENGYFCFDFISNETEILNIKMSLPGRHNIENACAAIAAALHVGINPGIVAEALARFKGIKRRFEMVYRSADIVFIDDYAHHPTELNAAIGAARELFPDKTLVGVFQPHLFSRTKDFAEGFAAALDKLDQVFLLDIYPAREKPMPGITADTILNHMKNENVLRENLNTILPKLQKFNNGVLLTLGAGDIDTIVRPLKENFELRK